jgi:Holliday junction resolvase RusA-like endonuclease
MTTSSKGRAAAGDVEFKIPLAPTPAARVNQGKWGAYYPAKYETFRKACCHWLEQNLSVQESLSHSEIEVICTFVCVRPKKPANPYPRGDIDNYEKALYDAITSSKRVWHDDVQISMVHADKRYATDQEQPHILVKVRRINSE